MAEDASTVCVEGGDEVEEYSVTAVCVLDRTSLPLLGGLCNSISRFSGTSKKSAGCRRPHGVSQISGKDDCDTRLSCEHILRTGQLRHAQVF